MKRILAVLLALFLATPSFAEEAKKAEPKHKNTDPVVCSYTGEVDAGMVFAIRGCIEEAKKDDLNRPIRLVIMSPGGSVFAGLIALQDLENSGLYVEMEAVNLCASMCAVMLEAPVVQKRYVRENTIVMIHGVSGGAEGDRPTIKKQLKPMDAINKSLMKIIAARSHIPYAKLKDMVEKGDWMWFVGDEAVKIGLADKVVKPAPVKKPVYKPAKPEKKAEKK